MNAKIEKLDNNEVKLEITIGADKFEEGLQKAYFKNAKHFSVPGFRKGKAPRNIVEKHYGESVLYEDAFNAIVPDIYEEIIKENNLEVVSHPNIDITQIGKGQDLIFTATVTVKPEVKLGKYKGVKVEKKEYKVSKEDIENKIKEMAEKNARVISGDENSVLEKGDTAVIDFEGFVDEVAFEGGKGENYPLELGSNSFIPGFEDQLIGFKMGEETDVNVTFPENYFSAELAGKPAVFKVKVNDIKKKELPEINDEFAKDVSEFDTLKELEADVKSKLEEENAKKAKYEMEEEAIKAIVDATTIDIPEVMIHNEIHEYIHEMESRLAYQGLGLEQYLQMMGQSIEDLEEDYKEKATSNIKTKLTLEAIFKAENIEVTEEDINEKLLDVAKAYGRKDAEEFVKKATAQLKEYAKEELKYDKAVKFIMENAK
mgnify:CR=1 FL=1